MAREKPEYYSHPVVVDALRAPIGTWLSLGLITPPTPSCSQSSSHWAPLGPQSQSGCEAAHATLSPLPYSPAKRSAMTLKRTAMCIVSKEFLPQDDLIRFVVSPQGEVYPDLTGKLPGAMAWVKADRDMIQKAIWRNSFASALRRTVQIPPNLLEMLITNLSHQALQTISFAKRAGELTFGFTKVDDALRSKQVGVYIVAQNASENGREKLERLAQHQDIPVFDHWTTSELSAAIGAENANHLSLNKGALARKLIEATTKLTKISQTQHQAPHKDQGKLQSQSLSPAESSESEDPTGTTDPQKDT